MECEVLHEFKVETAPASGAEEPVEVVCIHCGRHWPVGHALARLYDWEAEGVYGEVPPTTIFTLPPDDEDAAAEAADEAERARMVEEERPQPGSTCCHAPMRVESGDDGTSYGVCTACGKPADGQA